LAYTGQLLLPGFLNPKLWQLDPQHGDAIHRHFAFGCKDKREDAVGRIMRLADEMKHHPHVARGQWRCPADLGAKAKAKNGDDEPITWSCLTLTVTCTTHSPRGLSGKDARLAAAIDALQLADDEVSRALEERLAPIGMRHARKLIRLIQQEQARTIGLNRQAIDDALAACGCADAKADLKVDAESQSGGKLMDAQTKAEADAKLPSPP